MTLQEFIKANPNGWGTGNANLLVSSSVSGSYPNVESFPPYTVKGISIPFTSKNEKYIEPALKEVNEFRFKVQDGILVKSKVLGRQKRNGYYFFSLADFVINSLPTTLDFDDNPEVFNSEFVFVPYVSVSFINNDYNVLLSNSATSKLSDTHRIVDRMTALSGSADLPSNYNAIISQSAERAELQNCSYTKIGIVSSRYEGTRTSKAGNFYEFNEDIFEEKVILRGIPGNDPALALKEFKGSIHPNDSTDVTIKAIQLSDRTVETIFFDTILAGAHPNKTYTNFPVSSSFLQTEDGTRFVRSVNSKIYSVDKGEIYTTNELGGVIAVT
jgi:hypothetical protein